MPEGFSYGGQAVIEGVMMRGPVQFAIAVRTPDGQIALKREPVKSITQKYKWLAFPILRGMVALFETMGIGINALMYSANTAAPDEEQLTKKEMTLTTIIGMTVAIGIFVALPTLAGSWLRAVIASPALVAATEAAMRVALFVGYLLVISQMKDIQRVFQYHGAEHKVINTYEAGDELTVENVKKHTLVHKRCGTSFLLYVVVIAAVLFALVPFSNIWLRIFGRLAMMPLIAGISYEVLRFTGRSKNPLILLFTVPGLWMQGLTTREPDDDQIEVALEAFKGAREVKLEIVP